MSFDYCLFKQANLAMMVADLLVISRKGVTCWNPLSIAFVRWLSTPSKMRQLLGVIQFRLDLDIKHFAKKLDRGLLVTFNSYIGV
jgi:hypothetical protein